MHGAIRELAGVSPALPTNHPVSNTDSYNWWAQVGKNHGNPDGTRDIGAKTVIRAYLCPSDVLPKYDNNGYAKSNYAACLGSEIPWMDYILTNGSTSWNEPKATLQDGLFRLAQNNDNHYVTTFADVTDGTSNVIAVGEVSLSANVRIDRINRVFPLWAGGNNDWAGQWRICSWARLTGPYTYINNPEVNDIINSLSPSDYSFGSQHPGGANFLFADGSVHFLSETIDTTLYAWLGSIKDGNSVTVP